MAIGSVIKKLRSERNMTQEGLAELLGVTVGAVSQWECGRTMPDIALLPQLSQVFEVSADVLLEIDMVNSMKKEEVNWFLQECSRLHSEGKTEERVALCRQYQKKYPNDETILFYLLKALKTENEQYNEILQIGEHLLTSANTEYRFGALRTLCLTYLESGNRAEAERYARMMPSYQDLLMHVLEGESLIVHCQAFFYRLCEEAELHLHCLLTADENEYSLEEKHEMQMAIVQIFSAVFPDGDFGFLHERLGRLYFKMAITSAQLGKAEQALCELEKMCDHFERVETVENIKHTSLLVNRLAFEKEMQKKHNDIPLSKLFLHYMDVAASSFEQIASMQRFLRVKERLKNMQCETN